MRDNVGGNRPKLDGRWQYLPAGIVLLGVCVFWVVGILGGLRVLHSPAPALSVLIWLYVMLAAVGLSVVAAALALIDVTRRFRRRPRPVVEERPRAVVSGRKRVSLLPRKQQPEPLSLQESGGRVS